MILKWNTFENLIPPLAAMWRFKPFKILFRAIEYNHQSNIYTEIPSIMMNNLWKKITMVAMATKQMM